MAGAILLPDSRFRSPTAADNVADMRNENVFSAVVLQHGATGQTKTFTVPQGQTIPRLNGSAITVPTSGHQVTYTELTTNLSQAGQLGAALGDAAIKGIGCMIEQGYTDANGVLNTYGAGQQETCEILAKCFFQLKIAGKKQIEGPVAFFPTPGGPSGSISTTENSSTVSLANNGTRGPKALKLPIMCGRTDTVEGVVGVAGSDSLAFSVTSGVGQPVLLWVNLETTLKGDVR